MTWQEGMTKVGYAARYYDGKFAGIDANSGGYPYATENLQEMKIWRASEKEEAIRYVSMFPKLWLVGVTIRLEEYPAD